MNLEDECPGWLLGPTFSAIDIVLGVTLNKLALLGFQERLWSKGKRPRVQKLLREIQTRPAFSKAVTEPGNATGKSVSIMQDSAVTIHDIGSAGNGKFDPVEHGKVLDEMQEIVDKETGKVIKAVNGEGEERTWKSLW